MLYWSIIVVILSEVTIIRFVKIYYLTTVAECRVLLRCRICICRSCSPYPLCMVHQSHKLENRGSFLLEHIHIPPKSCLYTIQLRNRLSCSTARLPKTMHVFL
ncbi:unnamed protein product [Haemonchus placei]|uniref:Secreted protein n=1 Tax=Haemonchus placei TaxID=6290 RepID=A0A0N4WK99_HAEPC|nr:unnamed protein product [Haemonchus placei]